MSCLRNVWRQVSQRIIYEYITHYKLCNVGSCPESLTPLWRLKVISWRLTHKSNTLLARFSIRTCNPQMYLMSRLMTKPAYAPSEDSDQLGNPSSLIRVFAARMRKVWALSYPLCAQRRLWSDWADAQADRSFRWAQMLVLSLGGSDIFSIRPCNPFTIDIKCTFWFWRNSVSICHCVFFLLSVSSWTSMYKVLKPLRKYISSASLSAEWTDCELCLWHFMGMSIHARFYFRLKNRDGKTVGMTYVHDELTLSLEPCHEKTVLCHMRTTKTQINLHIRAVWSASLLFAFW